MSNHTDIIDGLKLICQCKGIKKATFKKLIAEGNVTLAGLQKATGAGSGQCGGARCTPRLQAMLEERNR